MKSKIVTHGGVSLDLSTVKCFKLNTNNSLGPTNLLIVEHKTRKEYVYNPDKDRHEIQEFNETSKVEYPDYDTAVAYRDEWEEIWQDYLNEID